MQKLLFSLDGRIGRQTYILTSIAVVVIMYVLMFLVAFIAGFVSGGEDAGIALIYILWVPIIILSFWINLALAVKRFHDQEKSGWWYLLNFIPYIGALVVLIMTFFIKGTDGPNIYGEDPLK